MKIAMTERADGRIAVTVRATERYINRTMRVGGPSAEYRDEWEHDCAVGRIALGTSGVLTSREYVGPNEKSSGVWDVWLHNGPVPGNINHNICMYHGWCGTTDDYAVYAHGQRTVEAVRKHKRGIATTIILSRDEMPDEA